MLLLLAANARALSAACAAARALRPPRGVDVTIDVDPAAVL